jgi:DNA polymerase-3 subunit delta'
MARAPAVAEIEETPESDRLDGFPHPRLTRALYGQERAERALIEAFSRGRMHHGWLITGLQGVGKATLAYRFAKYLLSDTAERDPFADTLAVPEEAPAARQVGALAHPGLLVLRRPYDLKAKRLRTEITIEEARRLRGFLSLTADEGAWRVVVIDSADELNIPAANAVLKLLEEPPPRTVFLLLSSEPGRLLPTIRSRCRTLVLEPLGADALRRAVAQAVAASGEEVTAALPSGADWDEIASLAGGSVRRFLTLHAAGGLDLNRRILQLFSGLPKIDWGAVHTLGDELSGAAAEERFQLFYDLLLALLAALVRASAGGDGSTAIRALAGRVVPETRVVHWAALWDDISAGKATALALNLDRKSLILDTFARLAAASQSEKR